MGWRNYMLKTSSQCTEDPQEDTSFKYYKQRSRLNARKYFFSQEWNNLPEKAVSVTTDSFKAKIRRLFRHIG